MERSPKELKSNEEIIEELTKDLESSCKNLDENVLAKDKTDTRSNCLPAESIERDPDNNSESDTQSAQDTSLPNDFVDEELLKDREIDLSETEKETLKNEAKRLKNEGNDLFKSGEYMKAISIYTQGLQTCPLAYDEERSILYANRAAAKLKCLDQESAITDCTKAIELNPSYVKAYVRRAKLYEEADKLHEAFEDYKKVLTIDPSHSEANDASRRLPPLISEKDEKLKAELLGKLKDLGNTLLKPFGLSSQNFELQKDPNSGGYSVKFNQNPS